MFGVDFLLAETDCLSTKRAPGLAAHTVYSRPSHAVLWTELALDDSL